MRSTEDSSRNLLIGVVFCAIVGLIMCAGYLTPPVRMSRANAGQGAGLTAPAVAADNR